MKNKKLVSKIGAIALCVVMAVGSVVSINAAVVDDSEVGSLGYGRKVISLDSTGQTVLCKKGGLKAAYNKINTIIRDITPEDDEMTEMSREDFFPSNIKLVYVILAVIWIISLVSGFLN